MRNKRGDTLAISSDAYFFEKDKSQSILVLGIGNYLMGDEGVGVQLIQQINSLELPSYMDILDGGTGGFLLLSCIEAYGHIIFVDATMDGKRQGTVTLIRPRFASDFPSTLSVHDVGLKDMVEALYLLDKKPTLHLITISIDEMKPMTIDLSHKVAEAIPKAIELIMELAEDIYTKNHNLV
ncbi:hydrogenase maturation protease [Lutimonas saemankumensis]|uniref:hydrogenase maturation protease n=1 Tax=Lutimonas saemankumensis TaxID=483016 RepID=UPI001CD71CE4|nr:hydrogenase maturation protease [Lutimonas saemankumensis]MCA0933367.1 hydrogenase maturation protease [Lutimonas saemankumensis]